MIVEDTSLSGVKLLSPKIHSDDRGFFMETFSNDFFKKNVSNVKFVQDNHSKSQRGVLRGLHYQINKPQGKLVRVISGEIYDVAVDLRRSSANFGKSYGVTLSSNNKKQLWVPEGFAHGFYVLSETAEFVYKCTNYYYPEYERCLLWNDKNLDVAWPLNTNKPPFLSLKDMKGKTFENSDYFN